MDIVCLKGKDVLVFCQLITNKSLVCCWCWMNENLTVVLYLEIFKVVWVVGGMGGGGVMSGNVCKIVQCFSSHT